MSHNKHIVSRVDLVQLKDNLCRVNECFTIASIASNSVLKCNKLRVATSIPNSNSCKFYSIFKEVSCSINEFLIENDCNIKEIKNEYPSMFINRELYNNLPNDFDFMYIDIKHCYWRVAYLMGLLNEELYEKYRDSTKYKLARNISLSILTSKRVKEYYKDGVLILKVECENGIYKKIYDNIRHIVYNFSGVIKELLNGRCIGYHVDGFMILPEDLEIMQKAIYKAKMYYSTTNCKKIDSESYWYGEIEKRI